MSETDPPPPATEPQPKIIAGFWRRLTAFVVDGMILGIPIFLLGFVFFEQFARLGPWGRAVGFLIALFYYGLMNSRAAGGQTLGKRLMKIRVVDLNCAPITFSRSVVRFAVLGAPFFLNGAAIPPETFNSWIGDIALAGIFGVGGSILYLLVFNRRNRRSLHDLIAGSVVVRAEPISESPPMHVWGGHYVVVTLLILAFLCAPIFLMRFVQRSPYKGVLAVQSALVAQEEIWYAAVFSGKGISFGPAGSAVRTTTAVTVWTDRPVKDYETFANKIAGIIFDVYPGALVSDNVAVNIIYGYDLGLASGRASRSFNFPPAEWHQRIRH